MRGRAPPSSRRVAWMTWPVFMAGFTGASWACQRAGFDPALWIPLHGALTGLLRPVGTSLGLLLLAAASELRLGGEPSLRRPAGWSLVS